MILHVFDDTFTYRGRVENWINMSWTEEFRGEGKFTLVTYDTDKYAEILRHGWYFYRTDRKIAMMAVKVERDTEKNTITVCGYSTLHLLNRRIIDLPVKCTNVEEGIYALINGDLRGLPYVQCAPVKGLTAECDFEIEGETMLDAAFALLEESTYGIRANFDRENKKHIIEVYDGVDRTYDSESGGTVFSQEFGNLRSLIATEDDDIYKNVAYVTGSASGDSRTVYYQYVSPDAGEQENWREMIVSGENQEEDESTSAWQKRQKQFAIEALKECKNALSFEVELGLGVFGEKYDLGDKVTCKSRRYGLQFDTQIMEYQYSYKAGAESVTVVMGDRPLDYVKSSIVKSNSGGASAKPSGGGSSGGTPGADGVSCTHSWNGTVLTVTSASGTSSADLQGPKGDTGARGPQGEPGQPGASGFAYNLLDNSDFTNLVNQRGQTSYTGSGYGIDRWRTNYSGDKVEVLTDGGVRNTVNSTENGWHFHQISNNFIWREGKQFTAACKVKAAPSSDIRLCVSFRNGNNSEISSINATLSSGIITVYGTAPVGTEYIRFGLYAYDAVIGDSVTLEWAALYEGSYTADTLPPYVPKGYAVELMECQRYYQRLNADYIQTAGILTSSGKQYVFGHRLIPEMRIAPTCKSDGITATIRTISGYSSITASNTAVAPSTIIFDSVSKQGLRIALEYDSALGTNNTPAAASIRSGFFEFSAEL